jgi:hypothetical protein
MLYAHHCYSNKNYAWFTNKTNERAMIEHFLTPTFSKVAQKVEQKVHSILISQQWLVSKKVPCMKCLKRYFQQQWCLRLMCKCLKQSYKDSPVSAKPQIEIIPM